MIKSNYLLALGKRMYNYWIVSAEEILIIISASTSECKEILTLNAYISQTIGCKELWFVYDGHQGKCSLSAQIQPCEWNTFIAGMTIYGKYIHFINSSMILKIDQMNFKTIVWNIFQVSFGSTQQEYYHKSPLVTPWLLFE